MSTALQLNCEARNLHRSKHAGKVVGASRLVEKVILLENEGTGARFGYLVGCCEPNWPASDDNHVVHLACNYEINFALSDHEFMTYKKGSMMVVLWCLKTCADFLLSGPAISVYFHIQSATFRLRCYAESELGKFLLLNHVVL